MTIPTRPAPAPPGAVTRAQNAAACANANLEQLRMQLQQQQLQQQQIGNGLQKLTIKLPPPPKGINSQNGGFGSQIPKKHSLPNNNGFDQNGTTTSSITRKFPQARYSPATNWDGSPFDMKPIKSEDIACNGNLKKVPPPRPPPPKVQVNGRKFSVPTASTSLITSIFKGKKTTGVAQNAANKAAAQNRVYGLSSGKAVSTSAVTTNSNSSNDDWNAVWNTATTATSAVTISNHSATTITTNSNSINLVPEAQLISFDSPPSSPTFTQKSNSDCVSVDSFSSDSNFSSPNNGSVSQPESGFEDDFSRSRPATTSPLDPWDTLETFGTSTDTYNIYGNSVGTAPVRNLNALQRAPSDNPLCNGKSLLPPTQALPMPTIIKPKIAQKPKAPKPPQLSTSDYYLSSEPPSPPMPKCAPPPPPSSQIIAGNVNNPNGVSLIDVISGKVDAIALSAGSSGYVEDVEQPYGIALYDFDGTEEGDLTFKENEKIYLLEEASETWYRGRTRAGCEGIFPVNYIDIKVPLQGTATTQKSNGAVAAAASYELPKIRCLYNFPAEVEGDLALKEHDMVSVIYKINDDWLYGEIDGRQGQFPANFLEYVPDNLPVP